MKNIKKWVKAQLAADEAAKKMVQGRVFAFRTGTEVPAPFVVMTGFSTDYAQTCDGVFPSSCSFSILCVAQTNEEAATLADVVKGALGSGYVAESDELVTLSREVERYDFEQKLFVNELIYNVN